MDKKTNKAKLEIHICHENSAKSYGFHENAKMIEKY